jgi:hypothetical protein
MDGILSWFADHPVLLTVMICTVLLAVIGLWYVVVNVVVHHIQVIIITLLCAAGFGSGCWVLYRGVFDPGPGGTDLIAIGVFLIAIFPIIFQQALRLSEPEQPEAKPLDRDALSKAFGITHGRHKP